MTTLFDDEHKQRPSTVAGGAYAAELDGEPTGHPFPLSASGACCLRDFDGVEFVSK
jgi:hypothetical protein